MFYVGKLDRRIYSCVIPDIITDEVIITDERILHIKERHPGDFERYMRYLGEVVQAPDYILEANKPNTAVVLKEIEENDVKFKIILRLKVQHDPVGYKNSILSFWVVGETSWKKNLKNKTILYKRV